MEDQEPSCFFCHQAESKVKKLVGGDSDVFICNYCVDLIYKVMRKEGIDFTARSEDSDAGPIEDSK